MGLPRLQSCCFVLDLKTGNIVMGVLNALMSFVLMVILIVITSTVGVVASAEDGLVESAEQTGGVVEPVDIERQAEFTGVYVMCIILVLMFLAKFLFDCFFVYGVITERAGIIKAYFVMWIVFFLLSMFTFFMNASHYSAGTICVELFYIGLNVYAILLSHSFYKLLNEREEV